MQAKRVDDIERHGKSCFHDLSSDTILFSRDGHFSVVDTGNIPVKTGKSDFHGLLIDVPPFLLPLKKRVPGFYGLGLMG
ncbi:hypothetical protein GGR01_001839 [Acetobacter oeni]|nr:hypothetical protein [Acetobacter oeni]